MHEAVSGLYQLCNRAVRLYRYRVFGKPDGVADTEPTLAPPVCVQVSKCVHTFIAILPLN